MGGDPRPPAATTRWRALRDTTAEYPGVAFAEAGQAMAMLAKAVALSHNNTGDVRAEDMLVPLRVCEDVHFLLIGMVHPRTDSPSRRELSGVRQSQPAGPWVVTDSNTSGLEILGTKCQ
jgi:hypothetical protein